MSEFKTKRLNLLIRPTDLERLKKIAYIKRTSVNDLINLISNDYANTHEFEVTRYDLLFNKKSPDLDTCSICIYRDRFPFSGPCGECARNFNIQNPTGDYIERVTRRRETPPCEYCKGGPVKHIMNHHYTESKYCPECGRQL